MLESGASPAAAREQPEPQLAQMDLQTSQRAPSGDDWSLVGLSGIVPGIIMTLTKEKMGVPTCVLPTGVAYAFFILGMGPFRFNTLQRLVATTLMLEIGLYWRDLLEALHSSR